MSRAKRLTVVLPLNLLLVTPLVIVGIVARSLGVLAARRTSTDIPGDPPGYRLLPGMARLPP